MIKECRKESLNLVVADLLLTKGISDLARIAESEQQIEKKPSLYRDMPHTINEDFLAQKLANITGVEVVNVEDILPCSPLQENMLQKSAEGFYNVEMLFEIHSTAALDISRLREAWLRVTKRHSTLRIIFTNSKSKGGHQIILKHVEPSLLEIETADEESTLQIRSSVSSPSEFRSNEPHHRLIVQRTREGKTFMKLEILHALTDAVSLGIVFQDLCLAYDNHLPTYPASQFSQYHTKLFHQAKSDRAYWRQYTAHASPCYIPHLANHSTADVKLLQTAVAQPDPAIILPFCQRNGISVPNFFQAIWTLVLKLYIPASSEVIFGYLVSGRDTEIEGIESIVGPLLSTLIYRNRVLDTITLVDLLAQVRDDVARSSSRKFCDLREVERELGCEKVLFNTMINFRCAITLFPSLEHIH